MSTHLIPVAVTQRVELLPERGEERRDALDQQWARFLGICGLLAVPVPNCLDDPVEYAMRMGAAGLVLTGGNDLPGILREELPGGRPVCTAGGTTAPERDRTEKALLAASLSNGWPVVGVCRGMQMLNVHYGGSLRHIKGHRRTRHGLTVHKLSMKPLPEFFDGDVNSFHDQGMLDADVAPSLEVVASAGGVVEAIAHPLKPHLGIMWHPERESPFSSKDTALFRGLFRRRVLPWLPEGGTTESGKRSPGA